MDDRTIGSLPAEIFASHGRKHPALITSPPTFNGMNIRQNLFAYTCQSLGMREAEIYRTDSSPRSSYEATLPLEQAASKIIGLFNRHLYTPCCPPASTVVSVNYVPRESCPAYTPHEDCIT